MNKRLLSYITFGFSLLASAAFAQAQCCDAENYRLTYKTVYYEQPVTTYRLQYETSYEEREVTVERPEWVTETRQRRYRVAKPVIETTTREERHVVLKPVWETTYRERSYDVTEMVTETGTREERYIVNRPVYETREREERYIERKQVVETQMRQQQRTTYDPVVTMRTEYVDQGGIVEQQVLKPGPVRTQLRCLPGGYYQDNTTGYSVYRRGGLHWVAVQDPACRDLPTVRPQYRRSRSASDDVDAARCHGRDACSSDEICR